MDVNGYFSALLLKTSSLPLTLWRPWDDCVTVWECDVTQGDIQALFSPAYHQQGLLMVSPMIRYFLPASEHQSPSSISFIKSTCFITCLLPCKTDEKYPVVPPKVSTLIRRSASLNTSVLKTNLLHDSNSVTVVKWEQRIVTFSHYITYNSVFRPWKRRSEVHI